MIGEATIDWRSDAKGAAAGLSSACAVGVRGWLDAEACSRIAAAVLNARVEWTSDFDDEQFSLGRAFYTHLEQDKSRDYFTDAAASDARVERHAPGLQARLRSLIASLVEGDAHARSGWCGAGVHVFTAGGHVARNGGVIHFDTEGLSSHHVARRRRAITAVVMLRPPTSGGGLRVWNVRYDGRDGPTDGELAASSVVIPYGIGDVVVIDSYRLHQIQPFDGDGDRISATIHAAEIDRDRWETWF